MTGIRNRPSRFEDRLAAEFGTFEAAQIVDLMKRNPALSAEGARGLITQHRDVEAEKHV
jgi:hypothetical protein